MLCCCCCCSALEQNKVSLFFSESPTNPYLRCVDIPKIAELCAATDTIVCIDSTFATPVNSRALALGADLVIHSATKYLAGHNDVLAGAICGSADLVGAVSCGLSWWRPCSCSRQAATAMLHLGMQQLAEAMATAMLHLGMQQQLAEARKEYQQQQIWWLVVTAAAGSGPNISAALQCL
jgi:cystathionine beta-lyase/cystathionine gamma-synthase